MKDFLKKISYEKYDIFFSKEMLLEDKNDSRELIKTPDDFDMEKCSCLVVVHNFESYLSQNPHIEELVKENALKKRLVDRVAILDAHGNTIDGKWCFFSNDKAILIQDFIDKYDGKYSLQMINSCNPNALEIYSKKSCILAPNNNHSPLKRDIGDCQLELYIPGQGYLNNYLIPKA